MKPLDCPFRAAERLVAELRQQTPCILVDMHCEATSEKNAMGHFLDGRVSAVLGRTRTCRPPTSACCAPGPRTRPTWGCAVRGTASSACARNPPSERFLTARHSPFEVAPGETVLQGAMVEIDDQNRARARHPAHPGDAARMSKELLRRATPAEQLAELTRGAVDVHTREGPAPQADHLRGPRNPASREDGIRPDAPDLHLGHTVPLERMRGFQDFGHTVIFLIGDFTATIGDPTGRNTTRPPLSNEQIAANAETYKRQVFKVLDKDRTEVPASTASGCCRSARRHDQAGGEVHAGADAGARRLQEAVRGGAAHRAARAALSLAQGYDSVALKADVELGSSDQLFNLLVGRTLQKEYGQESQVCLTGPLLEGTDAREENGKIVGDKMSKSLGNYVGIDEPRQISTGS